MVQRKSKLRWIPKIDPRTQTEEPILKLKTQPEQNLVKNNIPDVHKSGKSSNETQETDNLKVDEEKISIFVKIEESKEEEDVKETPKKVEKKPPCEKAQINNNELKKDLTEKSLEQVKKASEKEMDEEEKKEVKKPSCEKAKIKNSESKKDLTEKSLEQVKKVSEKEMDENEEEKKEAKDISLQKKRGRPRKQGEAEKINNKEDKVPKKKGRPRKEKTSPRNNIENKASMDKTLKEEETLNGKRDRPKSIEKQCEETAGKESLPIKKPQIETPTKRGISIKLTKKLKFLPEGACGDFEEMFGDQGNGVGMKNIDEDEESLLLNPKVRKDKKTPTKTRRSQKKSRR